MDRAKRAQFAAGKRADDAPVIGRCCSATARGLRGSYAV